MTLVLNYLWLLFGLGAQEKQLTFAQRLSFSLPSRTKVLWHRIVQPARESPLFCKPIALLLRTRLVLSFLDFINCSVFAVGLFSCAADLINWLYETNLPAFYGGLGDLALVICSFVLLIGTMAAKEFTRFWSVVTASQVSLRVRRPGTPNFVLKRMVEIEEQAKMQNAKVEFELRTTDCDPIISAKVAFSEGRTEKFVFAVYLPKNETPFCE